MSELVRRSHNVSILLYHIVCPIKYRKVLIDQRKRKTIIDICAAIEERYEMKFIEIGCDQDHVHFLIQSIPMYSPQRLVQVIKSITGREMFKSHPEIKKDLWGGQFWTDGYFIGTVGQHSSEEAIRKYVEKQGRPKTEYVQLKL